MQPLSHNSSQKCLGTALFLGLLYLAVLLVGSYFSESVTIAANAGHMLVHNGTIIIALIAATVARRKPDAKFSAGYNKVETIGGYTNGILLLVVAFFIALEIFKRGTGGGHEQPHLPEINTSIMGLTAIIGMILHSISAFILYMGRRESLNVYAAFLHILFDLIATLIAFITGILIYRTEWQFLDNIAGAIIVLLITISALRILWQSSRHLMDAVPKNIDYNQVVTALKHLQHIEDVHHVIIRGQGKDIMLSAHLVLKENCVHSNHWHSCREQAEQLLKEKFHINYTVLQMEAADEHRHD